MDTQASRFCSLPVEELLKRLGTGSSGLTQEQAAERQGPMLKRRHFGLRPGRDLGLFLAQFKSPIILILLFAAGLSLFLHDTIDALIILAIVGVSGLLGFWQERGAADAVDKLLALVQIQARVVREGREMKVPAHEVVPGDLVLVSAGDRIPADCRILAATSLYVDEAALTGESFPVEKEPGVLPDDLPPAQCGNLLFMGTHVISGSARALVVLTGEQTELGKISGRLKLRPPQTEFERGVRRFGNLLLEVTLMLVIAIFAVNVYLQRPVLDSFLFALALAVGLTPQLLPVIIGVNLAKGAKRMAAKKVIVKRLEAIENFGSMNVLCCDKTGTLTEGRVRLRGAFNLRGEEDENILFHAYLNAVFETGYRSPLDDAIRQHRSFDLTGWRKLAELPYDFSRKRLSILACKDETPLLITKGALAQVLNICTLADTGGGLTLPLDKVLGKIEEDFRRFSAEGLRVLGVARKLLSAADDLARDDEARMIFMGFLVLHDPPKPGIAETLERLRAQGVRLKMVTGDNRLVVEALSRQIGLDPARLLTGPELHQMSDEALRHLVNQTEVFAEVEPNQKERILLAAKKAGNVVGFMGDGINDATALHTADVGLSAEGAVDVAREAADIVLLEQSLDVLLDGVREGRTTFANTLKYVFMATSANFGNMFSMAGASLFLPFLPLLPKQILLTNLLTDLPEMAIANDRVDAEALEQPRRWDIAFIRHFMMTFGALSSIFDYLTFAALLLILQASPTQFRTGWFLESVISASLIVLVIRSRRPFIRSRPARTLVAATLAVVAGTLTLPYTPLAGPLGMEPLPAYFLALIAGIVLLYIVAAEVTKRWFYRRLQPKS
ncbi:magnesium-translocating P-type ATPase [Geoalkalibacter sp.]|uniref:magnesium-translocating P-type ATPase n=1 Tax=Geoalkalibacter sp. TaxID=3041440 RepID=UPI00272E7DDA|nr:magnesium-translocating P-type ATPase [Geoalkalibacter sp.]